MTCPWEQIRGFRSPGEFYRFLNWMDGQVRDGIAREVPVDRSIPEGQGANQKWFQHISSGEVWRIITPSYESRLPFDGEFLRVLWLKESTRSKRRRGCHDVQPFWRVGGPWEAEGLLNQTEFDEFVDWMIAEVRAGRARELVVPEEVAKRSLHSQRWFINVATGRIWELAGNAFEPLALPDSLKALLPK